MPLLEISDLRTSFFTSKGEVRAVDGVSLELDAGQTLGLVGESGCGKSMTALSVLRLVPPPGRIVGGRLRFDGRDLLSLGEDEVRHLRGNAIGMIFQEPSTALNPVFTVGEQVAEAIRWHQKLGRSAAWARAVEMLELVEIPEAARRARSYPHELSGGMRQRVMIAMALSCRPRLLIADEPTTALDVTIQAQILDLLDNLQAQMGMALLLVTHDLGIVAERADHVAVMYAGRIVEYAPTARLFDDPRHPYTRGLLDSIPRPELGHRRLAAIPGTVPDPLQLPSGCHFRDRCRRAIAACAEIDPPLQTLESRMANQEISPLAATASLSKRGEDLVAVALAAAEIPAPSGHEARDHGPAPHGVNVVQEKIDSRAAAGGSSSGLATPDHLVACIRACEEVR